MKSSSNDDYAANIQHALKTGDLKFDCEIGCAFQFGFNRSRMAELYKAQEWRTLATVVADIGFHHDLSYFYLGRSAEGLGFIEGAKRFYKRSRHHDIKVKCGVDCDGIVLPHDAIDRLRALKSQPEKTDSRISLKSEPAPMDSPVKDIKTILKTELIKGPLEKTIEFEARIAEMVKRYEGRRYAVEIEVNNVENHKHEMVAYDPDSGVMQIALPTPINWMLSVIGDDERTVITTSSIKLAEEHRQEFFLQETLIVPKDEYWIAIISDSVVAKEGGTNFGFKVDREDARELLASAKLKLTVEANFRYLQDNEMPLILTRSTLEPAVYIGSVPYRIAYNRNELPVRLINLELHNRDGTIAFERDFQAGSE